MATDKNIRTIGRAELISFPELGILNVPARIDTGARTSAIWASGISFDKVGKLKFYLFDKSSPYFKQRLTKTDEFTEVMVASSMGALEKRYKVKLLIKLDGRKIRASFTLSDRSSQIYPVLVGRNILRGKFFVDVKRGTPDIAREKRRYEEFEELLKRGRDI